MIFLRILFCVTVVQIIKSAVKIVILISINKIYDVVIRGISSVFAIAEDCIETQSPV